jgi:tRNA (cmo5U34)-methyltransferase
LIDVRAAKLLVAGSRLIDLAGIDLDPDRRMLEAALAGALEGTVEAHPDRVTTPGAGNIDPRLYEPRTESVGLAGELQWRRFHRHRKARCLSERQRKAREIDNAGLLGHRDWAPWGDDYDGLPEVSVTPQFHTQPGTYLERIRAAFPGYDELQDRAIDAVPFAPGRVLELGIGTGETTRRLLERYPDAEVTGLDASPEMVFRAREMGIQVRLARMQDPLPDGPWDLVLAVLAVHHLTAEQKRDLFRRVREQSRSLVLGDQVKAESHALPPEPGVDFLEAPGDLAAWSGGEGTWSADDLAVIVADYR